MTTATTPLRLTPEEWERLRDLAERLEETWRNSDSVDLVSFMQSVTGPLRLPFLYELIKTDLEMRYVRNRPLLLEDYLRQFPELGPASRLSAELLYEEYRVRHLHGDQPPLSSYRERFPGQFEALQRLLITQPFGTLVGTPPTLPPAVSGPRRSGKPLSGPPTNNTPAAPGEHRIAGGYTLGKRLGAGRNGEVLLAEAPGGIQVAVKRLFHALDDEGSRRELQALELIKSLRHPHLLQTQAFWVEEERLHIVIELADCSLEDRFKACRKAGLPGIPAEELLRFFREAAGALDYLHQQPVPVLHRDVKPANLLYQGGHAKVADFGLARLFEGNQAAATLCGTPVYMPPEIWKERVSVHSDQYSLAATYAEMRQGRRVYSGQSQEALRLQHAGSAPDLRGLTAAEQKVLLQALAKDPKRRYPSCQAFVDALAKALAPPPPPISTPFSWRALLLGMMLIAVSGLAVWGLVGGKPQPPHTSPPPAQPWLPPGFVAPYPEQRDGGYYKQIDYPLPNAAPVVFLLILPNNKDDPAPFYIMRDKTTTGQFRAALDQPRMQSLLAHWAGKHLWTVQPGRIRAAFSVGLVGARAGWPGPTALLAGLLFAAEAGRENSERTVGLNLPVMNVTVVEAHCFAELLGGKLPTSQQWDKAGGRFDGEVGPFKGAVRPARGPWKGEGIAVFKLKPLPVGDSHLDVSKFHCRDMAGNGREFTRDVVGRPGIAIPLAAPHRETCVYGRGKGFEAEDPYLFPEPNDPDSGEELSYWEPRINIGFRVVIDRLGGLASR